MAKKRGQALSEEEKRKLNKQNLTKLKGIFKYLMPYRGSFIIAMFFLVLSSINVLSLPFFAGKLINISGGYEYWIIDNINTAAILLIGIFLLQSLFSFLRIYFLEKVNIKAMNDLRSDLYKSFLSLPMSFYDQHRAGELTSRISNDVTMLRDTFSTSLAEFFRQVLTLIAGVFIIIWTAPSLSLFMLGTFPVLILLALVFGRAIRKFSKKIQDEIADSNTIVEETIQSIQSVKSFTNEFFELRKYRGIIDSVVGMSMKMAVYNGAFVSFIIFGLFGAIVGVMWYGASLVQSGEMVVGDLFSFLLYTVFIGASIGGLGSFYTQIQRAIGASERVLEIIDSQQEVDLSDDHDSATKQLNLRGNIQFKDLAFTYPTRTDTEVLKSVSFEIAAGKKLALVGHSGAGKSTIAQLLMRFYEEFSGSIYCDGQSILEFDLKEYRKNIALVPQEVLLFGSSIKENISYGKPGASDKEIEKAAARANALSFIESFPEGMETLVGDRGVKLSGGQRQRIAIARAILKDPSILILDEATSSLDSISEKEVQKGLDELMKDRTTIIIAHRLATVRKVDKILVLDHGKIQEEGSYEELSIKDEGLFNELLKLQLEESEEV
ncbi:MAG: ABC transporter transmembrane domain-containing protein [Bacteroidota bacterium]